MSLLRLPTPGLDLQGSLSISSVAVAAGASGTFANSGNLCTITTTTAHGLTFNPAAGTAPNYFVSFSGATAQTGVGSLNSNIFRLLSIPSTTTFTIYSTVTAATMTAANVIPVFFPPFTASFGSNFAGGPVQTISAVVTPFPPPQLEAAMVYCILGANCTVQAALGNPLQQIFLLDALSTPVAGTPASPTWTTVSPASTNDLNWIAPPNIAIWASTTSAGPTTVAVIN